MAEDLSASMWVAQSPERISGVQLRAETLLAQTTREHYWRLMRDWAISDDTPLPTMGQARTAAEAELETVCRAIGRLGALRPEEVFPPRRLDRASDREDF